jgi:hypothetical protein
MGGALSTCKPQWCDDPPKKEVHIDDGVETIKGWDEGEYNPPDMSARTEEEDEEEEDDDDDDDGFQEFDFSKLGKTRNSVCAEKAKKIVKSDISSVVTFEKTAAQKDRIRAALSKSFVFSALQKDEIERVVMSLKEAKFKPGQAIIKQGAMVAAEDDGLYVLEQGTAKVYKRPAGAPDSSKGDHVFTYKEIGGTFGDLALLYNCPRAATVEAESDCTMWAEGPGSASSCRAPSSCAGRTRTSSWRSSTSSSR